MNRFEIELRSRNRELRRAQARVLQLNVGKRCNQTCAHCHVNAGPARREEMSRDTIDKTLSWLSHTDIEIVDITGGAPELNPHFRYLVERCKYLGRQVMDRCNLTVCEELGQEDTPEFLALHGVEIVASLPCYGAQNVDLQRGTGAFEKSIRVLRRLNALGYGHGALRLHLVYNPLGATLPPEQSALEADYKTRLREDFGIEFDRLFALANLPIARFASQLRRDNKLGEYHELLLQSFNESTLDGLMCRDTINVDWQGRVYDCDFNQMLNLRRQEAALVWQLSPRDLEGQEIQTGSHCLGCTAGAGSSCGGALAST